MSYCCSVIREECQRHLVQWSEQNHRAFRIEELPVRFREATGVETKDIMDKWLAPLE